MRRFLMVLVLVQSLWTVTAHASDDLSQIELRVRCVEPGPCRYAGRMVEVELELFNAGKKAVSLPVEYIRHRGPAVTLVDNRSGKQTGVRMSPPAPRLLAYSRTLAPGESVRFREQISDVVVDRFASLPVDITVNFTYRLDPERITAGAQQVHAYLHVTDRREDATLGR